jgi:hypothetical protein
VQGPCGGPHHGEPTTVLALWPLAAVLLGQLAASGTAKLPALRRAMLLVAQPAEHRLWGVRNANCGPLTWVQQVGQKDAPGAKEDALQSPTGSGKFRKTAVF